MRPGAHPAGALHGALPTQDSVAITHSQHAITAFLLCRTSRIGILKNILIVLLHARRHWTLCSTLEILLWCNGSTSDSEDWNPVPTSAESSGNPGSIRKFKITLGSSRDHHLTTKAAGKRNITGFNASLFAAAGRSSTPAVSTFYGASHCVRTRTSPFNSSALVVNGVDVLMTTSNLKAVLANTTAVLANTTAELANTKTKLSALEARTRAYRAQDLEPDKPRIWFAGGHACCPQPHRRRCRVS